MANGWLGYEEVHYSSDYVLHMLCSVYFCVCNYVISQCV